MTSPATNPTTEVPERKWRRRVFFTTIMVILLICLLEEILGDGTPPKTSRTATQLTLTIRTNYGSGCGATARGPEVCTHFSPGSIGVNLKKKSATDRTPSGIISLKDSVTGNKFVEPVCKVMWSRAYGPHGFICPFNGNVAPGDTVTFTASYPGDKNFKPSSTSTVWMAPTPSKVTPTTSTTTPSTTTTTPPRSTKRKFVPTAIKTGKQPANGPLHATLTAKQTVRKLRNGYLSYSTPYVFDQKGNVPPTGFETFRLRGSNKVLCRVPARLETKVSCNLRTLKLRPGKYAFRVTYPGDVYYGSSHASGRFVVGKKTGAATPPTTTTTAPVFTTTTNPVVTSTSTSTSTTTWPVVTTTTTTPVTSTSTSTTSTTTTIPAPTVPTPPLDVIATNTPGSTSATISWTAPNNDGYGSSSGTNIATYAVTGTPGGTCTSTGSPAPTTCVVTGLTVGDTYTFTVNAANGVGSSTPSLPSNSITITSPATVPGPPQSVTANATSNSVTVYWSPPASDGGSPILSYLATDGQGDTCTVTVSNPEVDSCIITGLTPGNTYNIQVAAINAVGQGPFSSDPVVTTPIQPNTNGITSTIISTPQLIAVSSNDLWVLNFDQYPAGTGPVGADYYFAATSINLSTGAATQVATIPDPGNLDPLGMVSAGGDLWILSGSNQDCGSGNFGCIIEVNESTGAVSTVMSPYFDDPRSISADGTNVWVANDAGGTNGTGSLLQISEASSVVTQINSPDFSNPYSVSADGTHVWVGQAGETPPFAGVVEFNASGAVVQTFTTGGSISAVVSDGTDVWAAGFTGSAVPLFKINIATSVVSSTTVAPSGQAYWLASDGADVFVSTTASGNVDYNIAAGTVSSTSELDGSLAGWVTVPGGNAVWSLQADGSGYEVLEITP